MCSSDLSRELHFFWKFPPSFPMRSIAEPQVPVRGCAGRPTLGPLAVRVFRLEALAMRGVPLPSLRNGSTPTPPGRPETLAHPTHQGDTPTPPWPAPNPSNRASGRAEAGLLPTGEPSHWQALHCESSHGKKGRVALAGDTLTCVLLSAGAVSGMLLGAGAVRVLLLRRTPVRTAAVASRSERLFAVGGAAMRGVTH